MVVIALDYIEEAGERVRLLTEAERNSFQFIADEEQSGAEAARHVLETDRAARQAGAVVTWHATFAEPSYRDRLGIRAVGLAEARAFAGEHGLPVTGEILSAFLEDAQARVLFRSLADHTGTEQGAWEALSDGTRADLARLLDAHLAVPEAERLPLSGLSEAET